MCSLAAPINLSLEWRPDRREEGAWPGHHGTTKWQGVRCEVWGHPGLIIWPQELMMPGGFLSTAVRQTSMLLGVIHYHLWPHHLSTPSSPPPPPDLHSSSLPPPPLFYSSIPPLLLYSSSSTTPPLLLSTSLPDQCMHWAAPAGVKRLKKCWRCFVEIITINCELKGDCGYYFL